MEDKKEKQHPRKRLRSVHLSIYAMFLALSMILGYVEAQLPTPIPIPGVKLGLANLVSILTLFSIGSIPTAMISFLRIILLSVLFGNNLTLSYSLSGFLCSFLMMILFKKFFRFSTVSVSLIGGIFHNVGQILILFALFTDCRFSGRSDYRCFRRGSHQKIKPLFPTILLRKKSENKFA